MGRYIIKRLLGSVGVLFVTSILIFTLIRLSPGDPVDIMFGPSQGVESREMVSEETRNKIREELGLNKPLAVQYFLWLRRVVHLDFGYSFRSRQPVAKEILRRLPATVFLAIFAFSIAAVITTIFGILSAVKVDSVIDHTVRLGTVLFSAVPSFWLSLIFLFIFAVKLRWISVTGAVNLRQMILPAMTLALVISPQKIRVLRASMLSELNRPYIVFGKAKGLTEKRLIFMHAFRNAILPVVTLLGMSFAGLLGGSVIIETIFSYPGIGKYMIDSIYARDYPVIQAYVILATFFVVIINLIVDMSYTFLDPRVRLGKERD